MSKTIIYISLACLLSCKDKELQNQVVKLEQTIEQLSQQLRVREQKMLEIAEEECFSKPRGERVKCLNSLRYVREENK